MQMNESVTATLLRAAERARESAPSADVAAAQARLEAYEGDKRAAAYRKLRADVERLGAEPTNGLAERDAERLERLAGVLGRMAARPAVRVKTMGLPTDMTRLQAEGLRWAVQNSDPHIGD
jgi:hypothetical protein